MKPALAAMCLWVALAAPAEAGDPVLVLQETRTPVVSKKYRGIQHVVLLKNVSPYTVRGLRVTVEFYDFFDRLLLVRTGTPVPSSLRPGDTATLSVPTPALEAARKTRYRFGYAGGPPRGANPRSRRGGPDPAGKRRPTGPRPTPA